MNPIILSILAIGGTIILCGVVLAAFLAWTAPEGWEDEDGFRHKDPEYRVKNPYGNDK
jgi:hypothetical protein